ncbi:MAG: phosphoenolpyruvate--protein phosphotransferase [Bacilli bacterium]|nr:phosphoenolpyruvate--protein phosphotransferase [Bacilli bacterium]
MQYKGDIVFEGYVTESVLVYDEQKRPRRLSVSKDKNEYDRFLSARISAIKTFDQLYATTLKTMSEKEANLFQTYKIMAEDSDFEDLVRSNINDKQTAEDAVTNASKQLADTFSALNDEYMKQRAADVIEVGNTIVDILSGNNQLVNLTKPTILLCNDLSASILMQINRKYLKGLVLVKGNINSHVSIFARTIELPTIANLDNSFALSNAVNGKRAILDGIKGRLIIDPTEEEVKEYGKLAKQYDEEVTSLKKFVGKPSVTKDGVKLNLYANIASALEIENVLKNDGEGVGLFRSEFVYLASKTFPTEEFQFNYYREVLEEMKDKQVVIRTFDIGADKKVEYFDLRSEINPALGFRSIRICRKRPEVFRTQLRALYRASVFGKLSIMIPMIVSVEEVDFVFDLIKKVKAELTKEGVPFKDKIPVGIMIETPAAALISDVLAKKVDFFSIGTNDLSQYTLACDRLNPDLNMTFDNKHPAILRLIQMTVENAHKAGIPCSMCGELGRDPSILPFLAAIHLDEISCSSAYILKTRKALAQIDTKKVDVNSYTNPK